MSIYWFIVFAVILLGQIMPQKGAARKQYIIAMAILHIFVCGFRYQFITGDLIKYNTTFRHLQQVGYFSEEAISGWRNTGFFWTMKIVADLTNGNYQAFLFVLAVFTGVVSAVFIYRYSPMPWFSYLVWNAMTFYVTYDFLAIKQGMAMAVLMLSAMCIFEKKPKGFLILTLLAGLIHMPALCFLPAYFVANRRVNSKLLAGYVVAAILIFVFKGQIVDIVSELYYEDSFTLNSGGLGGRTILVILILMVGLILKGVKEKRFMQLFNLITVAAIIQMFSGFNNVFTRLADYYLQFTILFIPMIFYKSKNTEVSETAAPAIILFNKKSMQVFVAVICVMLVWWYHTTCLGTTINNPVDNFLDYRFMWEVG